LRLALLQINPAAGDLGGNSSRRAQTRAVAHANCPQTV